MSIKLYLLWKCNLTKVHDGACGGGNEYVELPLGNGMKAIVAAEISVVSVYASVHIFMC